MNREYHKWFSPRLNRYMELLIFGHAGSRVIVFPTRKGQFYDYENFGLVGSIQDRIEAGKLQLYCVDSVDEEALYAWHYPPHARFARHRLYESYIMEEVVPLTKRINPHSRLIAHGCSFGAYHAVNVAFRHPDIFNEVVAFSGRYNITEQMDTFEDLLSGYYDQDVYFHTPNHFVPNLHDGHQLHHLRRMRIVLVIGAEDPFYRSNISLSNALHEKHVHNELYVWDGVAHRPRFWRLMTRWYLGA